MILFALSNGFVTTLSFIHGISSVKDEIKATAGISLSYALNLGIFIGSFYSTFVMKPFT
jgi:predicted histidine transporter YuiF (NhaC family)